MKNGEMGVIESLTKLDSIKKMGDRYNNIWMRLTNRYAKRLDESPILKKVAYTNHDFSHHCKDIYVLIDSVLLKNIRLTEEEYFVLAVAVLMHDISMTKENCDRLCHSEQSAKYIQEEVDKGEDVWKDVPIQHISIIKQVVEAHSDLKEKTANGKTKIVKYTLQETSDVQKGELAEKIHVKWLAGILRLADELDVTNSRMQSGENRYENLSTEDAEERESGICWEQLNYFKEVEKSGAIIKLIINDQYLNTHIDDNRGNIIQHIKNVHQKISECIKEVNEHVFDVSEVYTMNIKRVVISDKTHIFGEEELGEILETKLYKKDSDAYIEEARIGLERNETEVKNENSEESQEIDYNFERKTLAEKITKYIYAKKLIQHGHYRLNRRFCSTDWIDVRTMLSDHVMGSEIVNFLASDLEKVIQRGAKDILAIGINMNGNILASQVAFELELPFTYLVPCKPGVEGSDMEKEFKIGATKSVILFTGVISSYDTITNIISKYLKNVEIIKIYTVLLRPINNEYRLDKERENIKTEIRNKIVYINKDFDCEMLSKEKCISAKYGECIALNRQAYDEVYQWPLAVKDEKDRRVFVNNIIGCDFECSYCYLHDIGIWKREKYTTDDVIAEFERLHGINPDEYIISIGCYAECMMEENISSVIEMVKYFANKGYYIQISTKSQIKKEWLLDLEQVLLFPKQLNIYVSMPTLSQTNDFESGATNIQNRILNFDYVSSGDKICMYMYIKPYLTGITDQDIDDYLKLAKKYSMKIIVGNKFNFDVLEGTFVQVGKNKMYETESDGMEEFISQLQLVADVYRHSVEPVFEAMLASG